MPALGIQDASQQKDSLREQAIFCVAAGFSLLTLDCYMSIFWFQGESASGRQV